MSKKLFFLFAVSLICVCVISCSSNSGNNTGDGGVPHVHDIRLINGETFSLKRSNSKNYELYRIDGTEETAIRSFQTIVSSYSQNRQCYYFLEKDRLVEYDPITNTANELQKLKNCKFVAAVTDHYLFSVQKDLSSMIINMDTGESYPYDGQGTPQIFNVTGDSILLWDDNANALKRLDCASHTEEILMRRALGSGELMTAACIFDETLYYAASDGILYAVTDDRSVKVNACEKLKIVALLPSNDGVLLASAGDDAVTVYKMTEDDVLLKLGEWRNAHYFLNGSCALFQCGDVVYCRLTTADDHIALDALPRDA